MCTEYNSNNNLFHRLDETAEKLITTSTPGKPVCWSCCSFHGLRLLDTDAAPLAPRFPAMKGGLGRALTGEPATPGETGREDGSLIGENVQSKQGGDNAQTAATENYLTRVKIGFENARARFGANRLHCGVTSQLHQCNSVFVNESSSASQNCTALNCLLKMLCRHKGKKSWIRNAPEFSFQVRIGIHLTCLYQEMAKHPFMIEKWHVEEMYIAFRLK